MACIEGCANDKEENWILWDVHEWARAMYKQIYGICPYPEKGIDPSGYYHISHAQIDESTASSGFGTYIY